MELLARDWIHCGADGRKEGVQFGIMQWNVLADALSHSSPVENFYRAPSEALKWSYRKELIIKEILRSEADIICLEEVDHFEDFISPELSKHGFEGVFLPKNKSSQDPHIGPDGCALLYRSSKFTLAEKKELVLNDINGKPSRQVSILAKMAPSGCATPSLCVAVCHLKAKNEADLRLAQGRHLLSEMAVFAQSLPSIICGDFNAQASEPVYKHFATHKEETSEFAALSSAYAVVSDGSEPRFTSWKMRPQKESKYTIDYVWYTASKLQLQAVWGVPTEEEIGEHALPALAYPSDHVALSAKFSMQ